MSGQPGNDQLKMIKAPETPGYERVEIIAGRRSFYVTVEMGTALMATNEAEARRMFLKHYVKDKPDGDFGIFDLTVTKGPPMYRQIEQ